MEDHLQKYLSWDLEIWRGRWISQSLNISLLFWWSLLISECLSHNFPERCLFLSPLGTLSALCIQICALLEACVSAFYSARSHSVPWNQFSLSFRSHVLTSQVKVSHQYIPYLVTIKGTQFPSKHRHMASSSGICSHCEVTLLPNGWSLSYPTNIRIAGCRPCITTDCHGYKYGEFLFMPAMHLSLSEHVCFPSKWV